MNLFVIVPYCLMVTILIEVVVAFIIKIIDKKDLLNVLLVNVFTNPLVVTIPLYLNLTYGLTARHIALVILEIFAVVSEGFIYSKYLKYDKINPYLVSLILNFGSFVIGKLFNMLVF